MSHTNACENETRVLRGKMTKSGKTLTLVCADSNREKKRCDIAK